MRNARDFLAQVRFLSGYATVSGHPATMKTVAIIPAGGSGKRMQSRLSKQYLPIDGKPLLTYTLEIFERSPDIQEVVLAAPEEDIPWIRETIIAPLGLSKVRRILPGGAQRQDSVRNGLAGVPDSVDIVLIHDAVRPFVSLQVISMAVLEAERHGAVAVGMPMKDTIKKVDPNGWILETLDRQVLWMTQTPQAFQRPIIQEAYRRAEKDRFYGTDDASLVERMGRPVKMIPASYENIKITTPEDLLLAEFLFKRSRSPQ
jgi:2-C-methyl-D-erythritol 4-phosphate cytidylyltransferase